MNVPKYKFNLPFFILKFFLYAILLFVFWIYILEKPYAILLGHITPFVYKPFGQIEYLRLIDNQLLFRVFQIKADIGIDYKSIISNFALFWSLVLASPFRYNLDRIRGLIIGSFVLFLLHIISIHFILKLYIHNTVFLEGVKIFIDGVLLGLIPILCWITVLDNRIKRNIFGFNN